MSAAARGLGSPFSSPWQRTSSSGDRGICITPRGASFTGIIPYYGVGQRHHSAAALRYDPMQQARSDHFVLAKLRRDVLKHGVAGGLRYGFGGLHLPVEFVSGQSQSQLVQWGHGKRSTKNKNAATGLCFSACISPFRRMPRPDSSACASCLSLQQPWNGSLARGLVSRRIALRHWRTTDVALACFNLYRSASRI